MSILFLTQTELCIVLSNVISTYLNGRFLKMAQVGRGLSGFMAEHHRVRVDESKGVDDNLALHTLNRIDDHGDGALRQRLETLLCVDIHARQPAAETRMRVIPADNHLRPIK